MSTDLDRAWSHLLEQGEQARAHLQSVAHDNRLPHPTRASGHYGFAVSVDPTDTHPTLRHTHAPSLCQTTLSSTATAHTRLQARAASTRDVVLVRAHKEALHTACGAMSDAVMDLPNVRARGHRILVRFWVGVASLRADIRALHAHHTQPSGMISNPPNATDVARFEQVCTYLAQTRTHTHATHPWIATWVQPPSHVQNMEVMAGSMEEARILGGLYGSFHVFTTTGTVRPQKGIHDR